MLHRCRIGGLLAVAERSQLCDACPEGKYQGAEGQTACVDCDDEFTCPEGSVVRIPASCAAGIIERRGGGYFLPNPISNLL